MKWTLRFALVFQVFSLGILSAGSPKNKTILGVSYDSCTMYMLKDPRKAPYSLFDKKLKLKDGFISSKVKLEKTQAARVASVFDQYKEMGDDTCDCRCVPFVVVFFRGSKPILQVFPNISGGDIWTVPKSKLSGKVPKNKHLGALFRILYTEMVHNKAQQKPAPATSGQ